MLAGEGRCRRVLGRRARSHSIGGALTEPRDITISTIAGCESLALADIDGDGVPDVPWGCLPFASAEQVAQRLKGRGLPATVVQNE